MKLVHLILAHEATALGQLERLINKLNHPDGVIYLHIDLKTDLTIFKDYFSGNSSIRFIHDRVNIKWAGYSMVQGELNSFQQILIEEPEFDFLNLLSAQDYPIRPIHEFHQFLSLHLGKAFMYCLDVETEWIEAKLRYTKYHFVDYNFPKMYFVQNMVNALMPERKIPLNLVIKGRSQWFTISKKHVDYVVAHLKSNKAIERFFKFSWAPDELVFQTLLFNSPFKNDIVNDYLRYIDWSEQKTNPKILTAVDFDAITASGKFFARKFNVNVDSKVLDLIDLQSLV